jgi:hypothetical protein
MAKTEVGNKCGERSFAESPRRSLASIPNFDMLSGMRDYARTG